MELRSWGHYVKKLTDSSQHCSAPGCANAGTYLFSFFIGNGTRRRLHYCHAHAKPYADDAGIALPGATDDLDLSLINSEELLRLRDRINVEFTNRGAGKVILYFDEEGPSERGRNPYAARLSWNKGRLERSFFRLGSLPAGPSRERVSGRYECAPGDIIEKRFERDDQVVRVWYAVVGNVLEPLVSPDQPGSSENEAMKQAVLGYLKELVSLDSLLEL